MQFLQYGTVSSTKGFSKVEILRVLKQRNVALVEELPAKYN